MVDLLDSQLTLAFAPGVCPLSAGLLSLVSAIPTAKNLVPRFAYSLAVNLMVVNRGFPTGFQVTWPEASFFPGER